MDNRRSHCPVACTLDLIGDKWTMLVIRDMFFGRTQYKEFLNSPEKIATNILASRLSRLVESGVAEKFPSPEYPGRDGYRLTEKGIKLKPILNQLADWGLEFIPDTRIGMKPKGEN